MTPLRHLRLLPLAIAAWALTACSGFSPGRADPGAAKSTGDQVQEYVINNGRLVAAVILALLGVVFIKWVLSSWPVRIIAALVIGGVVVYFATRTG